jgi:DNA-binding MarR family transcriptional regulator
MSTNPAFGTQLIGQTEKTLNAILDRELAGTNLTEPQWVALTLAVMSGDAIDGNQFLTSVSAALKVSRPEAQARLAELVDAQLLDPPTSDASPVNVTDAGRRLHARIRHAVTEITERLWGDLPADDLAAAGRVLGTVLERANVELTRS